MEKAPEGKLVSTWEMLYKDAEGEGHIETLHKYEYDEGVDEKRFLSQAAPTKITPSRARSKKRESLLLADIPDIHYGFRRLPDGTLLPTHRPEVMDVTLQIIKDRQPDVIILGGDELDLPELSRFDPDSRHFVDTMQLSIDGLHNYLSRLRADNPNAKIVNLDGNHERFSRFTLKNSMPLFGIRQANMPNSWATNSYPFLLRLDELDIDWVSGYPAASYKINDRLSTSHGEIVVGKGTAQAYLGRLAVSHMFHHTHRREYGRKTYPTGQAIEAFSFGCQADTTGSVPSRHNGVDDKGYTVERYENWDNGCGLIEYSEGDSPFQIQAIPIEAQDSYQAIIDGRIYRAREEVAKALATGQ